MEGILYEAPGSCESIAWLTRWKVIERFGGCLPVGSDAQENVKGTGNGTDRDFSTER